MKNDFHPWIPKPLRKYLASSSNENWDRYPPAIIERLLNDTRLVPFWKWSEDIATPAMIRKDRIRVARYLPQAPRESDEVLAKRNIAVMFEGICSCFIEPRPLDLMLASEREAHFADVSRTANKLIGLLRGTQFDAGQWDGASWYPLERAQSFVEVDLKYARQQGPGNAQWRTFFYDCDAEEQNDGFWTMAEEFPLNCLTDQLEQVRDWAKNPASLGELFDLNFPVKQSGIRGLKNRVLLSLAYKFRIDEPKAPKMPYGHLAELVNVGLDLPEEEQLNKTSARKQIERYLFNEDIN